MSYLITSTLRRTVLNKTTCPRKLLTQSVLRFSSQDGEDKTPEQDDKLGGFAKAYKKHTEAPHEKVPEVEIQTFASLLRNSKLVDMGDPEGKIVTGNIFHIVGEDLYIDFGWKFHCVCTRPEHNASDYVRGAKVRLQVKDLELSTRFLGSEKDLTILEADCKLLGLVSTPARAKSFERKFASS